MLVAVAAKKDSPLASLNFLFVPDARPVLSLAARQAQLEGGIEFVPGTDVSPQPHLTIAAQISGEPPPTTQSPTSSHALFRFSVREPGFYRFRLWCYWPTFQSAGLDLFLDGSVLKKVVGRGDPVYQKWHWLAVDVAADLGAGEHTLALTGWKPGAGLGSIEVFPAGGTQTTSIPGPS
ncbi:MAG: hypothetical protein A3J28_08355 [Acidobacteria bacterium RIFCSPLOWO2_12_FULL_60_22]|nr:MAG: hypothetical protein A3J28_08355 [Acidobacteria bacterium RIFCSPLOWO2_12_FULL_60_22]